MTITIHSRARDGFLRAGRAHPAGRTEYPAGTFSPAQLALLRSDPAFIVTEAEALAAPGVIPVVGATLAPAVPAATDGVTHLSGAVVANTVTETGAQIEAARIAAEEETARIAAETEAARIAAEEDPARMAANEEAARLAAEEDAARIAAEEDPARMAANEEAARLAAEEDAARIAAEEDAARIAAGKPGKKAR